MKKYKVVITDEALLDMEKIYEYIALTLCAPENAIGQYNRIADAIMTLETMPDRFAKFDCEPEYTQGIRRMIVDNFLVCYLVDTKVVTVINVMYGAADVHARLQKKPNAQTL